MTWTVGQVVAVTGRVVPAEGFPRRTVVAVYANGGCKLDDGSRWTAPGQKYGDDDWSRLRIKPQEQVAEWEAKGMHEMRVLDAVWSIKETASKVTDLAVLEAALAVLKG
jgi:hypothetical protein